MEPVERLKACGPYWRKGAVALQVLLVDADVRIFEKQVD